MSGAKSILRFMVFEFCEDYEQSLALRFGDGMPSLGVLDWRNEREPCATFTTRDEARKAIRRTEFYRLAMGDGQGPKSKECKIVPVSIPAPVKP